MILHYEETSTGNRTGTLWWHSVTICGEQEEAKATPLTREERTKRREREIR